MKYSNSSKILLFNTFAITLATFMFNPYLVIGAKEILSIGNEEIGFYLMIALIIGSFSSLIIGMKSSKKSLLPLLLISSIGSVISFYFMFISNEFGGSNKWVFLLALVCLRIFMSCATMVTRTIHMITNINRDCSKLFALAVTVFGLGSALGPLIGGAVFESKGFLTIIFVSMVITILAFLALCCSLFFIGSELKSNNDVDKPSNNIAYNLKDTWTIMLSSILFFCLLGQSLSYIPVQISTIGNASWIAIFFGVNATFLIVFSLPIINKLNKYSLTLAHKCSLGLIFITISLIIVPYTFSSIVGVVVVAILYSLGEILFSTYSLESLRGAVKATDAPKAVSIYTFLTTSLGLGIGQYVGVLLLDELSPLLIACVWGGICLFGTLFLKRLCYEKSCTSLSPKH